MVEKDFVLQQRFEVCPTANAVTDTFLKQEVKVEPRVMRLLCILAQQQGRLVKREQLVSEIWNDYGGGEAGLNHAVSTLRKLLNDTSKEMIETIPTKGYILHAEVSERLLMPGTKVPKPARFLKSPVVYVSLVLLAATAIYFFTQLQSGDNTGTKPASRQELAVPFADVKKKTSENWLNTIITVDDSTTYKLTVIGDARPQFYINGRLLSPDEMEQHLELIHNLKVQLSERQ